MSPVPDHPHDCALWLFEVLEQLQHLGDHWKGVLPASLDFELVNEALPKRLKGIIDASRRTIEFHPTAVDVYESVTDLVVGAHRRSVPPIFTVRNIGYTHGRTMPIPEVVSNYLDAVRLWKRFISVADHEAGDGQVLFFIQTFQSKVELRCEYGASDLCHLAKLDEFAKNYFESEHHRDQKRNIVRDALLETFKGQLVVRFAELLAKYDDFTERVRNAYTLYTSDFSFEKLRSEVDKQNLEDMLRLNKTLSDIQNQLLALPASLLLVGASVRKDSWMTNSSVFVGVSIFFWVMRSLVRNQCSSVEAIEGEIVLREAKIKEQPDDINEKLVSRFERLHTRIDHQRSVLKGIRRSLWVMWLVTVLSVINAQWPSLFSNVATEAHAITKRLFTSAPTPPPPPPPSHAPQPSPETPSG